MSGITRESSDGADGQAMNLFQAMDSDHNRPTVKSPAPRATPAEEHGLAPDKSHRSKTTKRRSRNRKPDSNLELNAPAAGLSIDSIDRSGLKGLRAPGLRSHHIVLIAIAAIVMGGIVTMFYFQYRALAEAIRPPQKGISSSIGSATR